MAPTETLTTAEAAELLGITERRVRQLAKFLHGERDDLGRFHFDRHVIEATAENRGTRIETHLRSVSNAERLASLEARVIALEVALARLAP